jgi:hypothetical protein
VAPLESTDREHLRRILRHMAIAGPEA